MPGTQYFSAPGAIYFVTGAPAAGTNEAQTITADGTVTGGTYRLAFEGVPTGAIDWDTSTADLETALNALRNVGNGGTGLLGVVVTGGPMSETTALTITFSGSHVARKAQGLITLYANNLVGGGSVVIAESVAGVDATHRQAPKGALLIREDAGTLFQNTGVGGAPTWATRT